MARAGSASPAQKPGFSSSTMRASSDGAMRSTMGPSARPTSVGSMRSTSSPTRMPVRSTVSATPAENLGARRCTTPCQPSGPMPTKRSGRNSIWMAVHLLT
jgi:hypothetical protein